MITIRIAVITVPRYLNRIIASDDWNNNSVLDGCRSKRGCSSNWRRVQRVLCKDNPPPPTHTHIIYVCIYSKRGQLQPHISLPEQSRVQGEVGEEEEVGALGRGLCMEK